MQDDGDSFVERAEMYYKKRPELVDALEDLCKSYRSLSEIMTSWYLNPIIQILSTKLMIISTGKNIIVDEKKQVTKVI